ncbi:unnamed protein product [Miscanthus lutarioriparius]|uniref:Uncharacterized protein n=1 Tax=Miscanthus lutarioriparius TaxID=422564 RepID=A0A811P1W5_9POAL|nr:unnamed protein product [Miscanthus lutarioriparius]
MYPNVQKIYTRNKKRPRRTSAAPDISGGEEDDSDHDAQEDQHASDPVFCSSSQQDKKGLCSSQGSIKWSIAVHVHHSETIPTQPMEADLEFAKGKRIALDGTQCLKRKGTKQIEKIEKHIKEERRERSNTYI